MKNCPVTKKEVELELKQIIMEEAAIPSNVEGIRDNIGKKNVLFIQGSRKANFFLGASSDITQTLMLYFSTFSPSPNLLKSFHTFLLSRQKSICNKEAVHATSLAQPVLIPPDTDCLVLSNIVCLIKYCCAALN